MAYINKALKDFVNLLKNDYQMVVSVVRADAPGGKKDYYLSAALTEDGSRRLFISIEHCTQTYLHSIFSLNGKHYYTPWAAIGSKGRDTIRYARKCNVPPISVQIEICDLSEHWVLGTENFLAFGYKFFKREDNYKEVKELIENLKNKYCQMHNMEIFSLSL